MNKSFLPELSLLFSEAPKLTNHSDSPQNSTPWLSVTPVVEEITAAIRGGGSDVDSMLAALVAANERRAGLGSLFCRLAEYTA